ncbi:hypothetical protein GWN91_05645, partial [Candidatus Saccharibacteria bacterium]|nr:hypothetical protein [Candidatus Saccharibacteria bacterium]
MNYVLVKDRVWGKGARQRVFPMTLALRLVAFSETLILVLSGLVSYFHFIGIDNPHFSYYGIGIGALTVVVIASFFQMGFYEFGSMQNPSRHIFKMLGALWIVFLIFLSLAFAFKVTGQISRMWVFSWFLSSALLLCLERNMTRSLFRRLAKEGKLSRRMI